MSIRDRVKELRRVRAGDLAPHPHNWRTHTRHQRDALRGVLADVGYADALLARELPDGSLQLVDGHLRAETTPNETVPVLVVDLDDAEAERVLLTHDPLAGMAGADAEQLDQLMQRAAIDNDAVCDMLGKVAREADEAAARAAHVAPEIDLPECYQVVVECRDAEQQESIYQRMKGEGIRCRVLTL